MSRIVVIKPDDLVWDVCPRCGQWTKRCDDVYNALSRHRDEYICSQCGTEEALEDAGMMPMTKWFCDKEEI